MSETKRRSGTRKLMLGDDMWQYKVGKGVICIWSPQNKVTVIRLNVFLGLSWDELERLFWKQRYTDHAGNVKPGAVRKWIEEHLV